MNTYLPPHTIISGTSWEMGNRSVMVEYANYDVVLINNGRNGGSERRMALYSEYSFLRSAKPLTTDEDLTNLSPSALARIVLQIGRFPFGIRLDEIQIAYAKAAMARHYSIPRDCRRLVVAAAASWNNSRLAPENINDPIMVMKCVLDDYGIFSYLVKDYHAATMDVLTGDNRSSILYDETQGGTVEGS